MKKFLFAFLCVIFFSSPSWATTITQSFTNSWTVDVWDYYGNVAAIEWEYQPYAAATNALKSVELIIDFEVTGLTIGDDFRYRSSFFTGWNPAEYQFYVDEWFYDVDTTFLEVNKSYIFSNTDELYKWINPLYGPSGHYYFESTTFNNSHTIKVTTELTYTLQPVPEPSTILLLGIGLLGLGWYGRKRIKS